MYEEYNLKELERLRSIMIENNLDTSIVDKFIKLRNKNKEKKPIDVRSFLSPVIKD